LGLKSTCFLLFAALLALLAAAPLAQAQEVTTIADARDQGEGATVTVEGVVTRAFDSFVRLQDESGPTGASALVLRQTSGDFKTDITIEAGTQLRVTGELSAFNGLLQINNDDLSSYDVLGQTDVPAPQDITLETLREQGGDYESELVRIEGLRFTGDTGGPFEEGTSYDVTDGTATVVFRVQDPDQTELIGEPIPDEPITYTGVTGVFFLDFFDAPSYQLAPIRISDLEATPTVFFPGRRFALAYEQGGDAATVEVRASGLSEGESVTVTVTPAEEGGDRAADASTDLSNFGSGAELTFSGPGASSQTLTLTPQNDDDTEGIERLDLTLATTGDGVTTGSGRFTVWILDDPTAQTTLYADLEGLALREQLREDFASDADGVVGPPTLGYGAARDVLYSIVFNDDGVVRSYYTGFEADISGSTDPTGALLDAGINTEHIWPRSEGAENEPALSNMHILAPARENVNTARSNYAYGEIPNEDTDQWYFEDQSQSSIPSSNIDAWSELNSSPSDRDARRFEPREIVEGNVARKSFYFAMAYPSRANGSFLQRQKDALRRWNALDPVDAEEQRRNVVIASQQGDELNPFQLDSTLVRRAFFTGDDGGGTGEVISIAEARDRLGGTTVTVEGVFTRLEGSNARIQDQSGPTGASGIVVRADALEAAIGNGDVEKGDRLRATGPLDSFNELRQLNDGSDAGSVSFEVIEADAGLPAVQSVSVAELAANGEDYESELVRVDGLTIDPDGDDVFQAGGAQGNYIATGSDGSEITLRIPGSSFYAGEPIPEGQVTFEGVLGQFGTDAPAGGYQLTAIDGGDLLTGDTGDALTVDFTRSFGDPDAQTGYRLVALPGDVDRPLAGTIDGANGSAWQAYWDDGSDENFFIKWDGSETFDFLPGRGFWLIANDPWVVQTTIPTVTAASDGSYAIDLHDGWNIISNPLTDGVAWSAVESANGGTLQPLWRFTGSYAQAETFATAQTNGEAFYFLNNDGRTELTIPAPSSAAPAALASREGPAGALALATYRDGQRTSTARVGVADGATDGLDAHDAIAPPGRFESASLRLPLPVSAASSSERRQQLAGERRTPGQDGYAFDLVLTATPGAAVTLRATGLDAFAGQDVVLVEPGTDRRHDLRSVSAVDLAPQAETTRLRLLVGAAALEEGETALPSEVTLRPGYPNPFEGAVTLKYELPEATDVRVAVYDLLGRRVRTLVDARREAGTHPLRWDGSDAGGVPMASGVYFVRLTAGDVMRSEKVVRVR
jgi:hypothetical protein